MYIFLKVFAEPVQNYVSINNEIIPIFQDAIEIIMNLWIYTLIKTTSQKNEAFGKDQTFISQHTAWKCLERGYKDLLWTVCCAFEKYKRQKLSPKNSPCV